MIRLPKIPLTKIATKPQMALQIINKSINRINKKINYKKTVVVILLISTIALVGKYTFDAYEKYAQDKMDRDFSRGVLAINTDKGIYKTGETALFQMSSLDQKGDTKCDSDLVLVVRNDSGNIVYEAKTQSGDIVKTATCDPKNNVTNEPDYILRKEFKIPGKYEVILTNSLTGKRAVSSFEVRGEPQDFEISRFGATRVNPEKSDRYAMVIKVLSKYAFRGKIVEKVPTAFALKWQGSAKLGATRKINDAEYRELVWDVDIAAGESVEFAYEYTPPKKSPEYYKIGGVDISDTSGSIVMSDGMKWQIASDAVSNGGNIIYADYSGTTDDLNFRTYTDPTTVGSEFTTVDTSSTSSIVWSKIVASPTREEKIAAQVMANGSMFILKCTSGCDATGDWSQIGTYSTVITAATANTLRPYDIAYEQLSGQFTIVFSDDNTTGKLYYCQYDGSSWSPATVCASTFAPGASNEINMSSLVGVSGQPEWVRLISKGSRLTSYRSDELMLAASDASDDLFLAHWDGSSWEDASNPTDTLTTTNAQKFDIAFEETSANNPSQALAVFSNTAVANLQYAEYTSGAWGTATSSSLTNNGGNAFNGWFNLSNDPLTDDIAVIITDSGSDAELFFWDGSTLAKQDATDDTSIETVTGDVAQVAWTRFTSEAVFMYTDSNALTSDMECWQTGGGNFTAIVGDVGTVNISNADDVEDLTLVSSPNNDRLLLTRRGAELVSGTGDDLVGLTYDGAGCADGDWTSLGTLLAGGASAGLEGGTIGNSVRKTHASAYTPYSPWSRNWRFYDDETVDNPSTGLNGAAENTTPTNVDKEEFFRLRINVSENGGMSETDSRKILQYTTASASCTPNTVENDPDCTWTDVGDTSETSAVFRYATSGETCTGCTDGATSNTPSLTGTTTGDPEVFYVSDKNAAQDADFDHAALTVKEIDFPLKAETVDYSTTYYFRLYEPRISSTGQGSIVYREQDNDGNNDCASSTCTYPSLTISDPPAITVSGTIYQSNESSVYDCSANNITVHVSTNGGANQSATCTSSGGTFSITTATDPGAADIPVVAYVDSGESIKGTTITLSSAGATNITGLAIYVDRVTVTQESATSITNAHLATADNGNAGIRYAVSSGNLTVESTLELHIKSTETFAPGGNVTTDKMHVVGTYTGSTETLTILGSGTSTSRPLYVNGGTFTAPSSTIFQGSSATDIESTTYNALSFTPTISGATTYTLLGAETINGNFVINPTAATTQLLTVYAGGTITVAAGSTTTISGTTSGTSTLDLRPSSTDYNMSTGLLDISAAGTLDAGSTTTTTITLTGTTGTLFTRTGAFTAGGSTVIFSGDGSPTALTSGTFQSTNSFYNLTLSPSISSSGRTYAFGSGAISVGSDFTISPSGTQLLTVNMSGAISVTDTILISRSSTATSLLATGASNPALSAGDINIATGGTLSGTGSTSIVTLTENTTPFVVAGTYTSGSTTIAYVPASTTGVNIASTTYYNVTFNKASNTFSLQTGGITVTNDLVITAGVLDAVNGSNYPITVGRNWTNSVGTAGFEARAGTVTFNTTTTAEITGQTTFYNFTAATAGKTIKFGDATTFRINGLLTLTGSSGPNYVTLNSVTGGSTQWTINHQGTESISYASITNSACDGTSTNITADNGTNYNGGNNGACWLFPASSSSSTIWKMDEGKGDYLNDSSGNSNTGTLAGTTKPAWRNESECVSGKCLYFEGTTANVTAASAVSVKTISFWIRPITTTTTILQLTNSAYVNITSGTLAANGFTASNIYVNGIPKNTIQANKWQHVAITSSTAVDASAIKLGINSTNYYKGFMDNVSFDATEQTLAQIRGNYIRGGGNDVTSASFGPDNSVLSDGLVGYWKLDENTGTSTTDLSGNNAAATLESGATWATGKYGSSVQFDGVDDDVYVGNSDALSFANDMTISAWIYPTDWGEGEYGTIFSRQTGSASGYQFEITNHGGINTMVIYNGTIGPAANSGAITLNTWQHVVVVVKDNIVTFYVNGSKASTPTAYPLNTAPSTNTYIGSWDGSTDTFQGNIDEVRAYNKALTPGEIQKLYSFAPGPDLYYAFDDNTGTSTVADTSGNNLQGTINGSMTQSDWVPGKFGSALDFDGSDDYVSRAFTNSTNGSTQDHEEFTISFWANSSHANSAYDYFSWGDTSTTGGAFIIFYMSNDGSDQLKLFIDNADRNTLYDIVPNTWYYFTITLDSSNLWRLYVNGTPVYSYQDDSTHTGFANSDNIYIGEGFDGNFPGRIDDFKIYTYLRTQGQIVEDMNGGHPVGGSPIGSQIGYWKLDNIISGTTTSDSSSQGNNLTVSGSTLSTSGKYDSAMSFSGSGSQYMYSDDNASLSITGSLTVSAFIKPSAVTAATLFPIAGKGDGSAYSYYLYQYGDEIRMYIGSASNYVTTNNANLTTGNWYEVAGVYNSTSSTVKIFVNGLEQSVTISGTIPSSISDGTDRFSVGGIPGSLYTFQISADSDDVGEDASDCSSVCTDGYGGILGVGHWDDGGVGDERAGIRFTNINIAKDTNIVAAKFQLYGNMYDGSGHLLKIVADAADNPATWSSSSKPSGITETSAKKDWDPTSWPSSQWNDTIDFKEVVQELVNRSGWSSGNAMRFVIRNDGTTGNNDLGFSDYNSNPAKLIIETGSGITPYNGLIDEVKLYSAAMTADQIRVENNRGKSALLGSVTTNSSNIANNSASGKYCVPGSADTCTAPLVDLGLNENTGTSAIDSSGNGNNCTITSVHSPTYVPGKIGSAYDIYGVAYNDDIIDCSTTMPNIWDGGATFEGWIYLRGDGDGDVTGHLFNKGNFYNAEVNSSGALTFKISFSGGTSYWSTATSAFPFNQWNHVVIRYNSDSDTNDAEIFINGIKQTISSESNATGTRSSDSATALYIGTNGYTGNAPMDGKLDEIKFYTYSRTDSQVAWDYNRGGPIAWYKFDECTGNNMNDSMGILPVVTPVLGSPGNTSMGTCATSGAWHDGATGKVNSAFYIDGGDYLGISSGTFPTTGAVSLWWKTGSSLATKQPVFTIRKNTPTQLFDLYPYDNGQMFMGWYNNGNDDRMNCTYTQAGISTSTWYHFVLTWTNGGAINFYVNGVQQKNCGVNITSLDATWDTSGTTWYIGRDATTPATANTSIDDLRIYNYVPSEAQIKNIYNEGSAFRFK